MAAARSIFMQPELGANTDEVRNSLGYDWEAIADLRKREII
jgi:crotonobetainyl-CoA:carnitine CoA-transferase CaiB-like acyl-CoA transferase